MTDNIEHYDPKVAALIERAGKLTLDELQQLIASWHSLLNSLGGYYVWVEVWDIAENAAVKAARHDVTTANATAQAVARAATRGNRDVMSATTKVGAAAVALVVKDLISEEHFDILTRPWRGVILDTEHLFQ